MKKKTVKIPIYFGTLIMLDVQEWDYVNRTFGYDITNGYSAIVFSRFAANGQREYYAAFNAGAEEITADKIAHEAVHLVNRVFKDVGIELDLENDEAQAYFTGWVVKQLTEFIYKK